MPKKCDNQSVGMLVWKNDKLLLIERKKFPFGFAPPAGHIDGDSSFKEAAERELREEVGLEVKSFKLIIEGRKENPCRRGASWHYWKIYRIEAEGEIKMSEDEAKQAGWFGLEKINELALKTEEYLKNKISEEDWQKSPGLEPVWYEWLKELKAIST